jgi:hypothetical protein
VLSFEDKNGDGIIGRINCPTYNGVANPQVAGGPACEVVLNGGTPFGQPKSPGDTAIYLGNPFGRTELAITPSATFKWLNVRALFDHRGGLTLNNSTEFFRCSTSGALCQAIETKKSSLLEQAKAIATRMGGLRGQYFEKADFWKLRELAFTATLPQAFAQSLHAGSGSITISGRNLKTWTDYTGLDPELNTNSNSNFNTADFLTQPPTKYWVARLNLTF